MAASNDSRSPFRGLTPLPGMFVSGTGCAMLFAYWTVQQIRGALSPNLRVAYIVGALLLVVIGAWLTSSATNHSRGFRFSRHRMQLPRQGVVYLMMMAVMFIGALLGRTNMLMLVFAMMAGPFVLNGWITFSMLKHLRAKRQVPRRTMAGDPVSVEVELVNERPWISSWLMTLTDVVTNNREELTPHVLFARVPPRSRQQGHYQLRLMQRGRYRFGPLRVTTRFPLGLVERGLRFDEEAEILVHPRLGRLAPSWKRSNLLATELVYRRQPRRGVFDDEFHSIREFRSGDNPRAIHWRTSARRNQLMIREFHQSRDQDLVVLLDLWQPASATGDQRERVELAVSLAATISVTQMRESRDSHITLLCAGREFHAWEGQTSPASIESLLDELAIVAPAPENDLPRLAEEARLRAGLNSMLVAVTTRPRLQRSPSAAVRSAVEAATGAPSNEPSATNFLGTLSSGQGTTTDGPQDSWLPLDGLADAGRGLQILEADADSVAGFFRLE